MHKISVIIPCYNVETYIEKCLESVLCQTYDVLDVIIINDGSTDKTAELIKRFTGNKRVRYIEQANAGVSAARNAGVDAASGDLMTFVDSDDYIEPQMYEKMAAALITENADMAVCNYNLIYDDRVESAYSKLFKRTVDVSEDLYSFFARYCACPRPNNYLWTRLYRTEIVKKSGIRFENFKLSDDTLFNFKLLPYIDRVTFVPDGLYNYLQRGNSNIFTAANKGNLATVYADVFDSLETHWRENGFTEWLTVLPIHAASRLRSVYFYSRLAGQSEEEILRNVINGFSGRLIFDYLTGAK